MNEAAGKVWVNGTLHDEQAPALLAHDRGFLLGDGVFETLVARGERVFRLDAHLARLAAGLATIGLMSKQMGRSPAEGVRAVLAANPRPASVVRITVSRGAPYSRGLLADVEATPTVVVLSRPWQRPDRSRYSVGFRATIAPFPRNERSPVKAIKSCSYVDHVIARQAAAEAGFDEALFLNTRGLIACACSANIFWVRSSTLATPARHNGALPGITRAAVMELAPTLGLHVEEGDYTVADLFGADEAFLTNSVLGIMPLVAVDNRPIGSGAPGLATARLSLAYDALLASEIGGDPDA